MAAPGNPYLDLTEAFNRAASRLASYRAAAGAWAAAWPDLSQEVAGLPLLDAHRVIVARAEGLLPYVPAGENAR